MKLSEVTLQKSNATNLKKAGVGQRMKCCEYKNNQNEDNSPNEFANLD